MHIHAVFSTKDRIPYLNDRDLRLNFHGYLAEISRNLKCGSALVGGVEDHVHILAALDRSISVADWIKELKRVSSMRIKSDVPQFAWQGGYGAFSVSLGELPMVRKYIEEQERHHQSTTFKDEFLRLLREHDIEWDARYVWD